MVEVLAVLSPEIIKNNVFVKGKTLDMLVKIKGKIVGLELNSNYYNPLHRRNAAYIFSKYAEEVKVSEDYKDMQEIIQINLTYNLPKEYPIRGIYKLTDKTTGIDFIDNLTIYEFNMDKIKKECYNEFSFLNLLDANEDELNKMCKGDEMMEKYRDEIIKLNRDPKFIEFMSAEEDEEKERNTLIKLAEEGGVKQGTKDTLIKTAKKMLKKKLDLSLITEITGLSKKELERLQ